MGVFRGFSEIILLGQTIIGNWGFRGMQIAYPEHLILKSAEQAVWCFGLALVLRTGRVIGIVGTQFGQDHLSLRRNGNAGLV